jgi:hypothetical protein
MNSKKIFVFISKTNFILEKHKIKWKKINGKRRKEKNVPVAPNYLTQGDQKLHV